MAAVHKRIISLATLCRLLCCVQWAGQATQLARAAPVVEVVALIRTEMEEALGWLLVHFAGLDS